VELVGDHRRIVLEAFAPDKLAALGEESDI
jgi:hypothetical protein